MARIPEAALVNCPDFERQLQDPEASRLGQLSGEPFERDSGQSRAADQERRDDERAGSHRDSKPDTLSFQVDVKYRINSAGVIGDELQGE